MNRRPFGQRGSVQGTATPPTNPPPPRDPFMEYLQRPMSQLGWTAEEWLAAFNAAFHPDPDRNPMPRTHYIPADVPGLGIGERLTACGIPVQDIIDDFPDKGELGSDRYVLGLPRPGQITCGTCAIDVPRWWDPERDKATEITAQPVPTPLTFHVKAAYFERACELIAELIPKLDDDGVRAGVLIIPTPKEQ